HDALPICSATMCLRCCPGATMRSSMLMRPKRCTRCTWCRGRRPSRRRPSRAACDSAGEVTMNTLMTETGAEARWVRIPSGSARLDGELIVPSGTTGVVLFAHGSGSSRHSPRNQYVARVIRDAGIGTLLFDLLTPEEEA